MAFDAALPIDIPVFAPTPERSRTPANTGCMSAPFRTHEGVSLAIGGLSLGGLAGALVFLAVGRVDAWLPMAFTFPVYLYAIHLAGLSCRDVLATRAFAPIGLFALHLAALLAWPLLLVCFEPQAWPIWLGLPLALTASSLFLLSADAPARTMYRVGGHVCLAASIGAYQWLWGAMGASAA